jgi:hypothetical protein
LLDCMHRTWCCKPLCSGALHGIHLRRVALLPYTLDYMTIERRNHQYMCIYIHISTHIYPPPRLAQGCVKFPGFGLVRRCLVLRCLPWSCRPGPGPGLVLCAASFDCYIREPPPQTRRTQNSPISLFSSFFKCMLFVRLFQWKCPEWPEKALRMTSQIQQKRMVWISGTRTQ